MPAETATRIVQVSDTHLSAKRAYFTDNFDLFVEDMARERPALVVNTGDLSLDGPADEDDLAFARSEHDRLPVPWAAIAGNHDIGEAPSASRLDQPIDDGRIARWRQHFGPNWWTYDFGSWRIVGLDTALMGSDHPEEARQATFFEEALGERGGRRVLIFMHMPPFLSDPDSRAATTSCLMPEPRRRFLNRCLGGGVAVIACGHLHVYRRQRWRGIDIVWAPGTSFVNSKFQRSLRRRFPRAGYIEWTLGERGADHRLIEPPLFISYDVGSWNEHVGSTTKLPPKPLRR